MSQHQAFRRTPVPQQVAQRFETMTIPAPTRGIIQSENESFMQPGAAVVMDNWKPTMTGAALRGGCVEWCNLTENEPVVSAFDYVSGANARMFAANSTKLYDVTSAAPIEVATGRTSGNYAASQLANAGGDWMIAVNDAGDPPLQFDGTTWTALDGGEITGPVGTAVEFGEGLVYVCKYRGRYYFIEKNSMNAWYLPLNAIQGALEMIPLAGATTKGGHLLFCAVWSIDAGDGVDDKLVFMTDLGEIIVFTGSDPSNAATWRQEGRYDMSPPLGMNAHISVGGDLLVATVDGVLPTSGAITKSRAELELAAVTRNIKRMWRDEALDKRAYPWTFCKWDEYGGMFITLPGGDPGKRRCLAVNTATGAWARFTGWDCMCFVKLNGNMFFGTQDGRIMQADRGGYDDGYPYVATIVGGWDMFKSPGQTITWRQARAAFKARPGEPFLPQIAAATDYVVEIPQPPLAGPDTAPLDLWDEGLWDSALWDGPPQPAAVVRNTGWVSVGMTGFSHAPIVQVTVAQVSRPDVELISIATTYERAGVNV